MVNALTKCVTFLWDEIEKTRFNDKLPKNMAIKLLRYNSPPYYYSLKATFFPNGREENVLKLSEWPERF